MGGLIERNSNALSLLRSLRQNSFRFLSTHAENMSNVFVNVMHCNERRWICSCSGGAESSWGSRRCMGAGRVLGGVRMLVVLG